MKFENVLDVSSRVRACTVLNFGSTKWNTYSYRLAVIHFQQLLKETHIQGPLHKHAYTNFQVQLNQGKSENGDQFIKFKSRYIWFPFDV
jgi:hypothetical protein